jgi:hypothetical protein
LSEELRATIAALVERLNGMDKLSDQREEELNRRLGNLEALAKKALAAVFSALVVLAVGYLKGKGLLP